MLRKILCLVCWLQIARSEIPLHLIGIYNCDVPKNALQKGFTLDANHFHGHLNVTLQTPFAFDDSIFIKTKTAVYENNTWIELPGDNVQKFCDLVNVANKKYPKLWSKLVASVQEDIKGKCPYRAGHYKLINFSVADTEVPSSVKNPYRALFTFILMKNKIDVVCKQAEVESDQ